MPLGEEFWGENFNSVTSEDNLDYNVVSFKNFTYNPARINVGSIGINMSKVPVAVSKAYPVFEVYNKEWIPEYLFIAIRYNEDLKQEIKARCYGTVRQSLSYDDFKEISIPIVPKNKQEEIVKDYLEKYEKYKYIKNELDTYNNI